MGKFLRLGLILFLSFWHFLPGLAMAKSNPYAINSVLGDLSFVEKFGHSPDLKTSPVLRIQTHLAYVETTLRKADTSGLSVGQKKQRLHLLNLLHNYWQAGQFPQNYHFPHQSRPTFIDHNGQICAVGYLIQQTAGQALAEKINARYQFAYLKEMQLPELAAWVKSSGLSIQELAMIQPAYPPVNLLSQNPPDPAVMVPSLVLDLLNLGYVASPLLPIEDPEIRQALPYVGLAIGGSTVAWGILNYRDDNGEFTLQGRLSLINLALGISTLLISSHQLLNSKDQSDENNLSQVHLGKIPSYGKQQELGIGFQQRF